MAFLRARQRAITALFPHQGNRRFIIPKRFGLIPTDVAHKTVQQTCIFRSNVVSGTLVTTGFTLRRGSIPEPITGVSQIDGTNTIVVEHGLVPAGEKITVAYDGTGDWVGDNGRKVGPYSNTGRTV